MSKKIAGLKWTCQPIKALGVWFGYDRVKCEKLNWEAKVQKFENLLNTWGKRHLSHYGKILIINTLDLSR